MHTEHLFSFTLKEQEDGRWSAVCNEMPGVATYGADRVEAIKALGDAISGAVAVYKQKGWPIPAIVSGAEGTRLHEDGVLLV